MFDDEDDDPELELVEPPDPQPTAVKAAIEITAVSRAPLRRVRGTAITSRQAMAVPEPVAYHELCPE